MFFGKKSSVGLDLGSHSVKTASYGKKGLEGCASASSVGALKLTGNVVATIPGHGTIGRYLEFPVLSAKELAVAGPAQAWQFIPYEQDQTNLSFLQVPPMGGDKKTALFFVADQKERVAEGQALLKGLKVQRMEVPVLALAREFAAEHPSEEFQALVHCGHQLTHVLIMKGRHPYYYREIRLAGKDFTYAFQQANQSTWEEAEAYKHGTDAMDREVGVEPFLQRWLKEVKRSLAGSQIAVARVFVSGGSAAWKGLRERLASEVELEVITDEPALYKVAAGLVRESA